MIICIISSVTAWNPQPAVGRNSPQGPQGPGCLEEPGPTAEVCEDVEHLAANPEASLGSRWSLFPPA